MPALILLLASAAHSGGLEAALERVDAWQKDISAVLDDVAPTVGAVVNYKATLDELTGRVKLEPWSRGSGVVVSATGLFMTNVHVVEKAGYVSVALNDGVYRATLVGDTAAGAKKGDIAVLQLHGKKKFAYADWRKGKMTRLKPGSVVFALGNPYGHARDGAAVATMGIISGKGRAASNEEYIYLDALQTDAEINPGNSGGPLFDMRGDLIGINGLGRFRRDKRGTGIGFAIPIDQLRVYLREIIKTGGSVAYGYHGIRVRPGKNGVKVVSVAAGSPGQTAGLSRGYLIAKVNGTRVTNEAEFLNVIGKLPEGAVVRMLIQPHAGWRNIRVKLGARPHTGSRRERGDPDKLPLGARGHLGFWWAIHRKGVRIAHVIPRTGAEKAGLKRGDELVSINKRPVFKWADLRGIVRALAAGGNVTVKIERGGELVEATYALCDAGTQSGIED
ncbi:MAG: trypsin-like peptidase domain-containing protein [Planctomycetota bacterium]|nr:trypsin-like peptidase domain-containing protein [Planctomycetota bacterium]